MKRLPTPSFADPFLSASSGGIDFYAYVANNPINLTDPFGLSPSFIDCFIRCAAEHYGIEEVLVRMPRLGGASANTNLLGLVSGSRLIRSLALRYWEPLGSSVS